jgi:hypothetical protein
MDLEQVSEAETAPLSSDRDRPFHRPDVAEDGSRASVRRERLVDSEGEALVRGPKTFDE